MLLFGFAFTTLCTGIFTAYFGAGKSRTIGFALIAAALAVGIALGILVKSDDYIAWDNFSDAFVAALAGLVGFGLGMAGVLFTLMKVDTVDDLEDLDLEDLEDLDLDEELKKLEDELAKEEEASDAEPAEEAGDAEEVSEPEPPVEAVPDEAPDYDSRTVAELKELLRERKLPISGSKDELISRLKEASTDEAPDDTAGDDEEVEK